MATGFRCGKCNNLWNYRNHLRDPEESDKRWKHHLREMGRLW